MVSAFATMNRRTFAGTLVSATVAQLAGCSLLNDGSSAIPLYVNLENDDSDSHSIAVSVRSDGSGPEYENTVDLEPEEEQYLGEVGKYEITGEDDVVVSVSVDSSVEASESFGMTGAGYFVYISTEGESITFESGHGDA